MRFTKIMLMITGVWPLISSDCTTLEKFVSLPLCILWHILLNFMIISMTIHTFTWDQDLLTKLSACGPISFFLTGELKQCAVIYRRKDIEKCIKYINFDWNNISDINCRKIMNDNMVIAKKLTYICGLFMYTGGAFFNLILPFVIGNFGSAQENGTAIRPFVYPGADVFFKNTQITPVYEFIYISQCFASWINFTISINACNLAAQFVLHACGQIKCMTMIMNTIVDNHKKENNSIVYDKISKIIYSHNRILRFSKNIEQALKEICLVEVVLSTLGICFLEYYCLVTWNDSEKIGIFTFFVLWCSLTFSIYIFCYIGNLLNEKCTGAGESIYMMNWPELPSEMSKIFVLVIAIAQNPPKITAGGIMPLSLESFGYILKTSFAYLNMIRTLTF